MLTMLVPLVAWTTSRAADADDVRYGCCLRKTADADDARSVRCTVRSRTADADDALFVCGAG